MCGCQGAEGRSSSRVASETCASACTSDGGPATAAQLNDPVAVAVSLQGEIYIVESAGNRVRKVAADGTITTLAGNGQSGFYGDGGAPTQARLTTPSRSFARQLAIELSLDCASTHKRLFQFFLKCGQRCRPGYCLHHGFLTASSAHSVESARSASSLVQASAFVCGAKCAYCISIQRRLSIRCAFVRLFNSFGP